MWEKNSKATRCDMDVDTDGMADRLYILLQNYEITPIETQLSENRQRAQDAVLSLVRGGDA